MDYKEKYENANNKVAARFGTNVAKEIFADLYESEDERIRKEVEKAAKDWYKENYEGENPQGKALMISAYIDGAIAWLEKQGGNNRLIEEIKKRKELLSKEKEKATSINDKLSLSGRIAILEELLAFTKEKQGEQKLVVNSEDIKKAIHIYLDWLDGKKDVAPKGEYSIRDMIDWLEKQGKHKDYYTKQELIDMGFGFTLNGDIVTPDEMMKDMKKYLTWKKKQGEQKPKKVSIWKHWKDGIAGNGEGKLVYLVKSGNTYRLSSCLSFECDYIELSDLDKLYVEKQGSKEENLKEHNICDTCEESNGCVIPCCAKLLEKQGEQK